MFCRTHIRWPLLVLCLASMPATAQSNEVTALTPGAAESAHAMRERADAMKAEAESRLEREKAECYATRSFPNGCIEDAKDRHKETLKQSRALAQSGAVLEREIRRRERELKEAERAAAAPQEEAERLAREQKFREDKARRDAEREIKLVKDAEEFEQRRARAAENAAARSSKQVEQAQKDQDIAQGRPAALSRKAEREKKHAERVAKIDAKKRDYEQTLKNRAAEKAQRTAEAEAAAKRNDQAWCCKFADSCCKPAAAKQ